MSALLISAGATGALAASDDTEQPSKPADDVVRVGNEDVTISDATVQIKDVQITGTGLPEKSVDDVSVTVHESSVTVEEMTIEHDGTTYKVGDVTVTVRNVGVSVENVSIGS
ncbi:hypothetical protein [Halegenticoccus tardaugens]|uniref:hypothetical protein n=1 Tax=Halegenticoccus tardaugens TaxID=2071624 RepID=UPI00100B5E8F|nr:hypothetical protein [Halegenticoccus tardaugens]